MAIELRFDNNGEGRLVVACVHCGEDMGDPRDGLVVWMPGEQLDPVRGTVFHADYAHRACEEQFLQEVQKEFPGSGYREVAEKINLPLIELFDALREPQAPEGEDLEARHAYGALCLSTIYSKGAREHYGILHTARYGDCEDLGGPRRRGRHADS